MADTHDDGGAQRPAEPSTDPMAILAAGVREQGPNYLGSPGAIAIAARSYLVDRQKWLEIQQLLREHKLLRELKRAIIDEATKIQGELDVIPDGANDITVRQALSQIKGIPRVECENCILPYGYRLKINGSIEKEVHTRDGLSYVEVVSTPVFVNRIFMRRGTEAHEVELVWLRGRRWKKRVVKRSQMTIARQLAEVSEYGLPVINANVLAEYLVRFEQANLSRLTSAYTTAQLGWISEGSDPVGLGFMAGDKYLRNPDAKGPDVAPSAELNAIARKVRSRGSLDAWGEGLRSMATYRSVWLAVYAALVSPLLRIFEWKNGCIEWASPTSEGKSTVIQFLMSVWQHPDEDIPNWHSTGVGLERVAAAMNDTFLAIDDTATAGPQNDYRNTVQSAIYMLVAGQSKVRGKADGGLQDLLSWRLFIVTSGEVPTGELGGAEGAAARILSITSQPLGAVSEETGQRIKEAMAILRNNFGVAGPAYVQWLMESRDEWPKIRDVYDRTYSAVSASAQSGAGNRAAHVIALLEAAAHCAHAALPLPWQRVPLLGDPQMVNLLAMAIRQTKESASKVAGAYEQIMSYVAQNPDRFWRDNDERIKSTPVGGWMGRLDFTKQTVDFHTEAFKRLVGQWKIGGERVVLRALASQGKLVTRQDGRNSIQDRVGTERFWFYKIIREDAVADEDDEYPAHNMSMEAEIPF